MSKIDSPSSNNSRTSSETSETQSVEEPSGSSVTRTLVPSINNISEERSLKKTKRMKDANNDKESEKRPPWRAVSISTLPKPDKNALLKAKLLDASRRLRAGKVSISIQTDMEPTKLMKEISLGPQTDLILLREIGVMTDGSYMKKRAGTDEFILTYSVSTVTDAIQYEEVSTQTLLPKLPEDMSTNAFLQSGDNLMDLKNFSSIQQKVLHQISKLRNASLSNNVENDPCNRNLNDSNKNPNTKSEIISINYRRPSLLRGDTLHSWHFELDEVGGNSNFQPYTISPHRPWKSFLPFSFDGFYNNYSGPQRLDWNIILLAIDELIQESNYLVDIIEDITRTGIEVVEIPKLEKPVIGPLPSEHWLPIIENQEKELESMKRKIFKTKSEIF